jgi:hypothetical protein
MELGVGMKDRMATADDVLPKIETICIGRNANLLSYALAAIITLFIVVRSVVHPSLLRIRGFHIPLQ